MAQYQKDAAGVPQLEKSFCLFLDVLGFKQGTESHHRMGTSSRHLDDFYKAFVKASEVLRQTDITWDYKIFTDNIVIGSPLRRRLDDEDYFGFIITPLVYYQLGMVLSGFFVRGGWAVGDLFMDDATVYGISLIDAYELESTRASNPRIVFSDDMKTMIQKHLQYYRSPSAAPQTDDLLKDSDGEYFVNYLAGVLGDDDKPDWVVLEKHKNLVEQRMNEFKNDPKTLAKYQWCAEYHNYFCSQFISKCPAKYLIAPSSISRAFSLIP